MMKLFFHELIRLRLSFVQEMNGQVGVVGEAGGFEEIGPVQFDWVAIVAGLFANFQGGPIGAEGAEFLDSTSSLPSLVKTGLQYRPSLRTWRSMIMPLGDLSG